MRQRLFFILLLAVIVVPLLAYSGTLTMSTYYPAPTGNYDVLKANSVGIGTSATTPTNRLTVAGDAAGYAEIGTTGCGGAGGFTGISLLGAHMVTCSNYNFASSPNDTNLYINRPSSRDIYFREANAYNPANMTIRAGGNVGIGTDNPAHKLEVQRGASATANIRAQDSLIWNNGTVNSSGLPQVDFLGTDQGGSIELGDSSLNGTTPYIDFHFGRNAGGANDDYSVRMIAQSDNHLDISTRSTARVLSIDDSRVGIGGLGGVQPLAVLDVGDWGTCCSIQGNIQRPTLSLNENTRSASFAMNTGRFPWLQFHGNYDAEGFLRLVGDQNGGPPTRFEFGSTTGVTTALNILNPAANAASISLNPAGVTYFNGGNVGIGVTDPASELEVTGRIHTSQARAEVAHSSGNLRNNSYDVAGTTIGSITTYAYRAFCARNGLGDCTGTGGVIIGDPPAAPSINNIFTWFPTSGQSKIGGSLSINGSSTNTAFDGQNYTVYINPPAGTKHALAVNGNILNDDPAGGFYYNPSDERLKENIKPIANALDKIKALNGVTFDWKLNHKPGFGLIAQNVEKVFPEIVHTGEGGLKLKSIDYTYLVAPLIEAVKEQQKEIDALKKEVSLLRRQVKK